jgi:UDP-3-O-[3-hydroxymyristoyl] glucosamine N-acyltransferase
VNKDLVIGKGAVVYAQSGVASSIEGGKVYFGTPAQDARETMKQIAWIKRLKELFEKKSS